MTLPLSGPISASMINVELGRASTAPFSINGAAERALAGVPSGTISFSDFYGKSSISYTAVMVAGLGGNAPDRNTGYFSSSYGTMTPNYISTPVGDLPWQWLTTYYEGTYVNQMQVYLTTNTQVEYDWVVANLHNITINGTTYAITWNTEWDSKYFWTYNTTIITRPAFTNGATYNIGWT